MVDIAASLSLTSTGSALDAGAVLGLETADTQAFGDILAGQVKAGEGTAPPAAPAANPFAALSLAAGNRQPSGNILPVAAAALPEAQAVEAEALVPTAPAAAMPVAALMTAKLAGSSETPVMPEGDEAALDQAKQADASPVHGLIKMLTAVFKSARPVADDKAEDAPAGQDAASADAGTDTTEAALIPASTIIQAQAALSLPFAAATPAVPASHGRAQTPPQSAAAPGAHAAASAVEHAAAQSAVRAAVQQAAALAVPGQPIPQAAAEAVRAPVLTVAPATTEAPAAAITLVPQPILVGARAVTARVKLATEGKRTETPAAGLTAPAQFTPTSNPAQVAAATKAEPLLGERSAPRTPVAEGAQLTERTPTEFVAGPVLPMAADGAAQAGAQTVPGIAPATGADLPRQDFAALVERLVEARSAGAAQSTHASVQHAEFGQVSLKFQQDGGDLSVSMTSADPDFAIAAQAAMPADRQNFNSNADAQSRNNQGQQQTQTQTNANSSSAHHEASAQRDATGTDQQGRDNRGGRQSDRNDNSNPSPRWGDRDQPQSRGGIFA